jgi:hypothetical protein
VLLRLAEPQPAADTQLDQFALTPNQPPGEISYRTPLRPVLWFSSVSPTVPVKGAHPFQHRLLVK